MGRTAPSGARSKSVNRRGALLGLLTLAIAVPAGAQEPSKPPLRRSTASPDVARGITREEQRPGDTARAALDVALFLPREIVSLFFSATGTAAGLIEDEQVIPRVDDLLNPPPGEIHVFPTAFVETGRSANVGVRAIARAKSFASSVRAGFGGVHDVVAESKLRFGLAAPVPIALSLEALHDERPSLGYLGVGQRPESDPRNAFAATSSEQAASYRERRERFIVGGGLRPMSDLELLASSSLSRRHLLDPPDPGPNALSRVFEPGSVPGADAAFRVIYSELALRGDTRESRGGPEKGWLLEGYLGRGDAFDGADASFVRAGARGALFLEILHASNVLSPALALDGLSPVHGPVPFVELVGQPDFRGFANRRDFVSLVGSLDYRWTVMRYLGARLLADVAYVAPDVASLPLDDPRVAGGFAFDVFSRSTQLGTVRAVGSSEGFSFSFNFGVSSGFGDRQHRN